jgi:predicted metal-dependent hydrolase
VKSSSPPIAYIPLHGKKLPVYTTSQWPDFVVQGDKVLVTSKLAQNFELLNQSWDRYCQIELRKIVDRQIRKLRTKAIKVKLDYNQNGQKLQKNEVLSVNDYLDKFGYSRSIEIEIGSSQKEWGINKIDPKQKKFTLFFNQNLLKYDSGKHIQYVVAHELVHVFHRDHGPQFQASLNRLYAQKNQSESFWGSGIRTVFNSKQVNSGLLWFIIAVAIGLFLILLSRYLGGVLEGVFSPQSRF